VKKRAKVSTSTTSSSDDDDDPLPDVSWYVKFTDNFPEVASSVYTEQKKLGFGYVVTKTEAIATLRL
jgi:hypothetical protein